MFITYLRRELRQRMHQTIAISLGLALGIGLVVTVSAISAGLKEAQDSVLRSLYGIGSQLTVTQPSSRNPSTPPPSPSGRMNRQDTLFSRQLGPLPSSSVVSISELDSVATAAGALTLTDLQVVAPPSAPGPGQSDQLAPISTRIFEVEGVDVARPDIGPLSSATPTAGRAFTAADTDADMAVLDATYAGQQSLTVGSTITVAGIAHTVIGIVERPEGSAASEVYIPLRQAQALAGLANQVNLIYIAATSSADIDSLRQEISKVLPAATVTSSDDVADAIIGSLTTASDLADDLGRWLAVAVLAAAFLMASLLTVAAVSRRAREFGTLKAIGWPSRRIVAQVMGEAIATGATGGALGVAVGCGAAALITAMAPSLTASIGQNGQLSGQGSMGAAEPVTVQLSAPVALDVIVLAVLLAVAGELIAGWFGGWQSARLRPAATFAQVT